MIETIGIWILIFFWIAVVIGLLTASVKLFFEGECLGGCVFGGMGLVCIGAACLMYAAYAATHEEADNPCVAWGPSVTTYMMVGKIMTPVTHTPCIRRQNETDK